MIDFGPNHRYGDALEPEDPFEAEGLNVSSRYLDAENL
jgi:hypothetical protein